MPKLSTPCILRDLSEGRTSRIDDEVLWRKGGSFFPIEYTATPIRRGTEVIGSVISFSDITERKAAAVALAKAKESADRIVDAMPIPTAVTRIDDGAIIRFNMAMQEFQQIDAEAFATMHPSQWYANPEERSKIVEILKSTGMVD